jgi:hypothetical protein
MTIDFSHLTTLFHARANTPEGEEPDHSGIHAYLDALYKDFSHISHLDALRTIYEAGIEMGGRLIDEGQQLIAKSVKAGETEMKKLADEIESVVSNKEEDHE